MCGRRLTGGSKRKGSEWWNEQVKAVVAEKTQAFEVWLQVGNVEAYERCRNPSYTPDYNSWLTLLDATLVRNHAPILQTAGGLCKHEVLNKSYHRQYRIRFTLRRDLECLKRKSSEKSSEDAGSSGTAKRQHRISSTSRVFQPECIFCRKYKFLKGISTRENLIKARQDIVCISTRKAATPEVDSDSLNALSISGSQSVVRGPLVVRKGSTGGP
ncbi:hypothetical protein SK128_006382 [Halocaridina rubra]|uniref:Uncharacterized protein n=1 Tax=Halocaridina rubra TaxID=373956 RepID=A0AAN8X2R3_HALRR